MAERFEIMEKALLKMLEEKKYLTLREMLSTMNPSDVAGLFADLEDVKIPLVFRLLPKELAAETFVEMESEAQELLIRSFSDNELKEIVDELYADDLNWIAFEQPRWESFRCAARTRYHQAETPCTVYPQGDRVRVKFDTPIRAITAGQAVVFYDGEKVVGGGTIL